MTRLRSSDAVIPAAARPPTFEIFMTVSSGTYVRSIIHDIAIALGTTAHIVKLTRTRQGEFSLNPVEGEAAPVVVDESFAGGCVEWSLLESAIKAQASKTEPERGEDGYLEWERELLHRCKEV
jgi:tRNA pseudouridine55 synthase